MRWSWRCWCRPAARRRPSPQRPARRRCSSLTVRCQPVGRRRAEALERAAHIELSRVDDGRRGGAGELRGDARNGRTDRVRAADDVVGGERAVDLAAWPNVESELPSTAIVETSAIPIISAPAVCAVRRGLRAAFRRPSRPGVPSTRASGRPSALASGGGDRRHEHDGRDEDAERAEPDRARSWLDQPPRTSSRIPSARCTMPRRPGAGVAAAPTRRPRASTSAATGGIRTARRAGTIAESVVTPIADDQRDDRRARLEHERRRRQREPECAEQRLEADRRRRRPGRGRSARRSDRSAPPRSTPSGRSGGGWRRRSAAARAHACAARR